MPEQFTDPLRLKAAQEIARTFGLPSATGTPENIVNQAVEFFASGRHTPEAWKLAGQMLKLATKMDIAWSQNSLRMATKLALGLKESTELPGDMLFDQRHMNQHACQSFQDDLRNDLQEATTVSILTEADLSAAQYVQSLQNIDKRAYAQQALAWYTKHGHFPNYGDAQGPGSLSVNLLDRQAILRDLGDILGEAVSNGMKFVPGKPDPNCKFCNGTGYVTTTVGNPLLPRNKQSRLCTCTTGKYVNEASGTVGKIPVAGKMVPDTEVEKKKNQQKLDKINFETNQERDLEAARRRDFDKEQQAKKAKVNEGKSMVKSFTSYLQESGQLPFFDASDLGWKPGFWPMTFNFPGFGLANRVELTRDNDGDVQFARYMTTNRQEIQVFND